MWPGEEVTHNNRDNETDAGIANMPAQPPGFAPAHMLDNRNVNVSTGYQMPLLGLAHPLGGAMSPGVPIAYSGLPGYNFIPYPHHRHIAHMNAASPYHHHHHAALLARGGAFYSPYRPAGGPTAAEDPGSCRLAKVATRESTGALKAWLNEHLKNPYPTKGEKIMLAIITKMSLTQVSTWFANARRRLKKENRVSWASKGKSDEEEEEEEEEDEDEGDSVDEDEDGSLRRCRLEERDGRTGGVVVVQTAGENVDDARSGRVAYGGGSSPARLPQQRADDAPRKDTEITLVNKGDGDAEQTSAPLGSSKDSTASQKPKIWSLAETATSETVKRPTAAAAAAPAVDPHPHLPPGGAPDLGLLWADWAARNGFYIPFPSMYPSHGKL
ncbi:hypothetical protein CRUP_010208 [Coryphaenoides rupestris]|nr:hypothetical protein CRUP_010208 [Coryphaenoides rupestris]